MSKIITEILSKSTGKLSRDYLVFVLKHFGWYETR